MMTNIELIEKLNNDAQALTPQRKNDRVFFYGEQVLSAVTAIAEQKAPYGNVALFWTKPTFEQKGKTVSLEIRKRGIKTVNLILPNVKCNAKSLCELFNLPEDVRMVFVFDKCLFDCAKYFSALREIPCVLIVSSAEIYGALNPKIYVNVGEDLDLAEVFCERHVIVDFDAITKSNALGAVVPYLYATLVAGLSLITDYRIDSALSRRPVNKRAYTLARQAVLNGYAAMEYSNAQRLNELLYSALRLELANANSCGNIYNHSALSAAMRILGIADCQDGFGYAALDVSLKIMGIYSLYLNNDYSSLPHVADYTERTEFLVNTVGGSEYSYLKGFKQQTDMLACLEREINRLKEKLAKEVEDTVNLGEKIRHTYFALGGKKFPLPEGVNQAIKHSGDLAGALNGMTLCREVGITDSQAFN